MAVSTNGVITWVPLEGVITGDVVIDVNDEANATQMFTVSVTPVNDAPIITGGLSGTGDEYIAQVTGVISTDVDAESTAVYSIENTTGS